MVAAVRKGATRKSRTEIYANVITRSTYENSKAIDTGCGICGSDVSVTMFAIVPERIARTNGPRGWKTNRGLELTVYCGLQGRWMFAGRPGICGVSGHKIKHLKRHGWRGAMSGSNGANASNLEAIPGFRKITVSGLRQLLEGQDFKCALTGRDLTPAVATLDHIIPLKRGGMNTLDNVQVLHVAVNQAKGTMTTAEFIAVCREVLSYADTSDQQQE